MAALQIWASSKSPLNHQSKGNHPIWRKTRHDVIFISEALVRDNKAVEMIVVHVILSEFTDLYGNISLLIKVTSSRVFLQ